MGAGVPTSVLLVSGSLNKGGAERFTSTLLQHFDRSRIRPALCLMRDDIGYPLPADVALYHLDYRQRWQALRTIARLRRLIDELKPDVMLSNLLNTNLVSGMALRRAEHRPVWIARVAADPVQADGWLRSFFVRRTYPRADHLVVNSRGLVDGMVRRYPFTAGRLDVLANPTDFETIDRRASEPPAHVKPPGVKLVIAVGRLSPQKRHDLMIDAFRQVSERHPAILWICGEGPGWAAIRKRIDRLALADSVRLLGFCSNPFALLRQADLFVMSSDFEGLPNALIEAQGLGLPAVATRCDYGPDEIIDDGRTGLLTPVGDAAALAEAMSRLLADTGLRRRMAAAARELARERFAAAPLTRAWEALLLRQARPAEDEVGA